MALDDVDRGILFLLQRDARRITTAEMAEQVGVSASTVRNRIAQMEEEGIIRSYHPEIDYEQAGLQLHMEFICSAPNPERSRLAERARDVRGAIRIYEVLNDSETSRSRSWPRTPTTRRASTTSSATSASRCSTPRSSRAHVQPFDHFGQDIVEGAP